MNQERHPEEYRGEPPDLLIRTHVDVFQVKAPGGELLALARFTLWSETQQFTTWVDNRMLTGLLGTLNRANMALAQVDEHGLPDQGE